jgi:hypothetical protein
VSSTRYPLGLKAILDGDVDFLVNTISMQMYSGAAVYNAAHDFLNDIAGSKAGSPVTCTITSTTGGLVTATVPAFTPPAVTVVAIVLYVNTGVDATSRLLGWIDQRRDGTTLAFVGNGTPITLNWTGPIYSIGGA